MIVFYIIALEAIVVALIGAACIAAGDSVAPL